MKETPQVRFNCPEWSVQCFLWAVLDVPQPLVTLDTQTNRFPTYCTACPPGQITSQVLIPVKARQTYYSVWMNLTLGLPCWPLSIEVKVSENLKIKICAKQKFEAIFALLTENLSKARNYKTSQNMRMKKYIT